MQRFYLVLIALISNHNVGRPERTSDKLILEGQANNQIGLDASKALSRRWRIKMLKKDVAGVEKC
jgi:hypothetical protein